MKSNFAKILQDIEKQRDAKLSRKLPGWENISGMLFPDTLCLEQCSSSASAAFKAKVLEPERLKGNGRIADLTGGLGVDSIAFAQSDWEVLYFERKKELASAVENNIRLLGQSGIEICCEEISIEKEEWKERIESFLPSWIYIDPARRDSHGKKVFLIEDCSPDVLTLLPYLWGIAQGIMIKLSPMADLSMLADRLGRKLGKIYIVELNGEIKELLCVLRKDWDVDEPEVIVCDANKDFTISILRSQERDAEIELCTSSDIKSGFIYEGGPAIIKSGAYKLICKMCNAQKLDISTHLYYREDELNDSALSQFIKHYKIIDTLPFSKEGFKQVSQLYPQAEISARNLPISSEQLRKRCKVKSGGDIHIFACSVSSERMMIVCKRLPK